MVDNIYQKSYIYNTMNIDAQTLFSALSNDIRLRCLMLLQRQGELCVCELTHALGLSQPMISRHLALLRHDGLVSDRRVGQWIYYQINAQLDDWIKQLLATTAQANADRPPFSNDSAQLSIMADRPGPACCA